MQFRLTWNQANASQRWSGNHAPQGDMRGFSNRTCCMFQPCEVVQFVSCLNCTFVVLYFPPLNSLIGGFGKYWAGKYIHWLGQCDGVGWVVAAFRVATDTCVPYSRLVAWGLLLTLESLPTLTGIISSIGDEFNFYSFWIECHSKKKRKKKPLHKVPLSGWTREFV